MMKTGRTFEPLWQSIKLIEEILLGLDLADEHVKEITKPLKELHFLRSKISGHASGKEAKQIKVNILKQFKTYLSHFRELCTQCDRAVRNLQIQLAQEISIEPPSTKDR
jgi:hypothetical protein